MNRGFGIDATVDPRVATDLAVEVESLGYESFWVNGSPPEGAFEILGAVAAATDLEIGVGVLPLTAISIEEIISAVGERSIPQERLWLGVGSGRKRGALDEVRHACAEIRSQTDCQVVSAAVGPRMTQQAAEIADCVLFTWWPRSEVAKSRQMIDEAAADAGTDVPLIASYVRCGLLPGAQQAIEQKAARYASIPRYADVFARNGMSAEDTVVKGADREELLPKIEHEEIVIDVPIVRAITPDDSLGSLVELATVCRP